VILKKKKNVKPMKTITIADHNKKLDCQYFIHISAAAPPDLALPLDVEVLKAGTNQRFLATLISAETLPLNLISPSFSRLSHELRPDDLVKVLTRDLKIQPSDNVSIYTYWRR
jgi:hypothetical protein